MDDEYLQFYCHGIENEMSLYNNKKVLRRKSMKILLFFIGLSFGFTKKLEKRDTYLIINGKCSGLDKIDGTIKGTRVYYGQYYKKVFDFLVLMSPLSVLNWMERINVFITAIKCRRVLRKTGNIKYGFLGYLVEFTAWFSWFKKVEPAKIVYDDHYTRTGYFFSALSRVYNVCYTVYQHGLVRNSSKIVPNKLYYSELYAFDYIQMERFKRGIIANSDCEFHYYKRKMPSFIDNPCKDMYSIGIIEQPRDGFDLILKTALDVFADCKVFLMMHPLGNVEKYKEFLKYRNLIVLNDAKIFNVDCIITSTSTLSIEYCVWGYDKPVFISTITNIDLRYGEMYTNICFFDSVEDLDVKLRALKYTNMA